MQYRSEALDPARHDLDAFTSTAPSLDDWLRDHAALAEKRGTGRTFVWIEPPGETVLAYYTLVGRVVQRDAAPAKTIGRGLPLEIPAILLARLALSTTLHGHGHGRALLADALSRALAASRLVAARFVVVDALDENAASFYEHFGFRRVPGTMKLLQKMTDIEAALGPLA